METPAAVLLLLLLLLLLVLLWLLRARLRHEFPFPPGYPPEAFFIQDELVISGSAAALADFPRLLPAGVAVQRIDQIELERLGAGALACAGLPTDFVIALYRVTASNMPLQALIDALEVAAGPALSFYTELNRIAGLPHDPEPSPHDPEPSPASASAPPLFATEQDFLAQWAFEMIGLRAALPGAAEWAGRGVRVGVFDTSPFALPPVTVDDASGTPAPPDHAATVAMPAPFGDLRLSARHARQHSTLPGAAAAASDNLRSHGLFAAGLVHALAPQAQVKLVQVLGADRRGTMYDLMRAVFDYLREVAAPGGSGSYPRRAEIVLNFSLGVRIPPDPASFAGGAPSSLAQLAQSTPAVYKTLRACHNLLQVAGCLGAVVVAAAGNDSGDAPGPLPAHFPALLAQPSRFGSTALPAEPHILSVAACTFERGRACFSNTGSVAAPGGDGVPGPLPFDGLRRLLARSLPALSRWVEPLTPLAGAQCQSPSTTAAARPTSVIGPVLSPVPGAAPGSATPRYRYWSGTSFATPIVAGLAALQISCQPQPQPPAAIRAQIEADVLPPPVVAVPGLGAGIARLPASCREQGKAGY